jgi:hypothetical protein
MSRGSFKGGGPQVPQLTKWLRWANAADNGTLSIPDMKGGDPATQSTGGLKPAVGVVDGRVVGTFATSVLVLPLSDAVNGAVRFGVAFWLKLSNVSGTKTALTVQNVAGGASTDKLTYLIIGNVLQARAMTVDRRAQISPLDTNWRFVYLGIDCSKSTESTQVLMGLDGALDSGVFFSSDTAWPTTLGSPTGNMLIGAGTAAGAGPIVGSMGDLFFFSDQLSLSEIARVKDFEPPF